MEVLILGGTAWLGREVAVQAMQRGHRVTCLARGQGGAAPAGASFVPADREQPGAYDAVADRPWDSVVDVSRQPGQVRAALSALGAEARHWTFISTGNVYASQAEVDADESAPLLAPFVGDLAAAEDYGPAKVACEEAARAVLADRLLIARCGLIGGPGDVSDRAGYWPARVARATRSLREQAVPMLIPDVPDAPTAIVDVRDLTAWILDSAENALVGTFDAVGPRVPFGEWIELCRTVLGHAGPVIAVPPAWLLEQGVEEFMGPESLPLWIGDPQWQAFQARSGAAARAAGLAHRPRSEFIVDTVAWERELGLDRERRAGLSPARERELLTLWADR